MQNNLIGRRPLNKSLSLKENELCSLKWITTVKRSSKRTITEAYIFRMLCFEKDKYVFWVKHNMYTGVKYPLTKYETTICLIEVVPIAS